MSSEARSAVAAALDGRGLQPDAHGTASTDRESEDAERQPGASAAAATSAEIAIHIENLSKRYQIYDKPQDRLKHSLYPPLRRLFRLPGRQYFREFWALRDISFDVLKGETVGVIGRNGSGKSTLLQLVCGTLAPTTGTVSTNGRIAALLELGSGFNPEFTGRENVYVNGAILGLSRAQIDERFDDIVEFSGIGDFVEQPVKTYSSGMFVRLAFSVNIMSQPEIMVVDEALAVGDMAFQAKCMTALRRIQENGATVLFVSHDVNAVKSLCTRAVYLEKGRVVATGPAGEVAERYVRDMREEMNREHRKSAVRATGPVVGAHGSRPEQSSAHACEFKASADFDARVAGFRYGSGEARFTYAELLDANGDAVVSAAFDQEVLIRMHFVSRAKKLIAPTYYVHDDKKMQILGAGPRQAASSWIAAEDGDRFIATYRTRLPLHEGTYSIELQLTEPVVVDATSSFLDVIEDAMVFRMERRPEGRLWAKVLVPNTLHVDALGKQE